MGLSLGGLLLWLPFYHFSPLCPLSLEKEQLVPKMSLYIGSTLGVGNRVLHNMAVAGTTVGKGLWLSLERNLKQDSLDRVEEEGEVVADSRMIHMMSMMGVEVAYMGLFVCNRDSSSVLRTRHAYSVGARCRKRTHDGSHQSHSLRYFQKLRRSFQELFSVCCGSLAFLFKIKNYNNIID